jgi:hypothetical protein
MAVKQTELTTVSKTEAGATVGSTGQVVDHLTQRALAKKEQQLSIKKALDRAKAEANRTPAERAADAIEKLKQESENNN